MILEDHLVRVVNRAVEQIDLEESATAVCRRGHVELSSADDAEGAGVCVLPEDLHVAEDRGSAAREYPFHVAERGQHDRTFGRSMSFGGYG